MFKYKMILAVLSTLLFFGCEDNVGSDYEPEGTIAFAGVGDKYNIITLAAGQVEYDLEVSVDAKAGISEFSLYRISAETGNDIEMIEETRQVFTEEEQKTTLNYTYKLTGIDANQAIRAYVRDNNQKEFTAKCVLKITPSVIFTKVCKVETNDVYFGSFFATWYEGRVYPLREAVNYAEKIDLSFGVITVDGVTFPAVVSPAARESYGLSKYTGMRATKMMLSQITPVEYDAVKEVDDTPLKNLTCIDNYAPLRAGTVYIFETQDGLKGLLYVTSLSKDDAKGYYTIECSAKVQAGK